MRFQFSQQRLFWPFRLLPTTFYAKRAQLEDYLFWWTFERLFHQIRIPQNDTMFVWLALVWFNLCKYPLFPLLQIHASNQMSWRQTNYGIVTSSYSAQSVEIKSNSNESRKKTVGFFSVLQMQPNWTASKSNLFAFCSCGYEMNNKIAVSLTKVMHFHFEIAADDKFSRIDGTTCSSFELYSYSYCCCCCCCRH